MHVLANWEEKMGLTLQSKNYETEIGYGGFFNLRHTVAKLISPEVGELYSSLMDSFCDKEFIKKYNKRLSELSKEYNHKYDKVIDFLNMPDCDGIIWAKTCRDIYEIIKNYDDDICYGYCGREDPCMFADFKRIIKDAIDTKGFVKWY